MVARRPSSFRGLVLILALALVLVACEGVADPTPSGEAGPPATATDTPARADPEPEPTSEPQSLTVGDTADLGPYRVTLHGTSLLTPEYGSPDPGQRYLGLELSIENTSGEAVNLSTMLQMELRDGEGRTYSSNIAATVEANKPSGGSLDGQIHPGELTRNSIGYQVPEDIDVYRFVFVDSLIGNDRLVFEVDLS